MGMDLSPGELLPGERVILTKKANCVVRLSDVGLQRLRFDQGLAAIGMGGQEAIGGQLHLTSYRLVFASHAVNRAVGKLSLFLPTVVELRDTSKGLAKKLTVRTELQEVELVVWGVPALITAIDQQRRVLTPTDAQHLFGHVAHAPQTVGDAFTVSATVDHIARHAVGIGLGASGATGPLVASSLVGLWELAQRGRPPG